MRLPAPTAAASKDSKLKDFVAKPLVLCLLLAALTLAVYQPATHCGFINYDDPKYFSDNSKVQAGLSTANIAWAFTTGYFGNWHPLTWLSLMLDAEVFGNHPFGPHLTSVLFHTANGVLLLLLLRTLTKSTWRSALVAGLFALHPLHVESVAWVAERKDVLSTFFGLLALLAYAQYAAPGDKSGGRRRKLYVASLAFFALSLMSKPMLVTLPCLLLLLDWWPLGRIAHPQKWREQLPALRPLLREKIPFFALALAACVATYIAQKNDGAVATFTSFPMSDRLGNALISYARYLGKTFWPEALALPYPGSRRPCSPFCAGRLSGWRGVGPSFSPAGSGLRARWSRSLG
jgi:hypothetical protein